MADLIGRTCPFCQAVIKPGEQSVVCSRCGTAHHRECWAECGRCTTPQCVGQPAAPSSARRTRVRQTPTVAVRPARKSQAGTIWTTLVVCALVVKAAMFLYSEHQKEQRQRAQAAQQERVRNAARQRAAAHRSIDAPRATAPNLTPSVPPHSGTASPSVVQSLKALNARLLDSSASSASSGYIIFEFPPDMLKKLSDTGMSAKEYVQHMELRHNGVTLASGRNAQGIYHASVSGRDFMIINNVRAGKQEAISYDLVFLFADGREQSGRMTTERENDEADIHAGEWRPGDPIAYPIVRLNNS
jgi:hypothetical protein